MKVLVCGQRDFTDRAYLFRVLDALRKLHNITCVVEGEAKGADSLARGWAEERHINVAPYPAKWNEFGKAAGPIRNQEMLDKENPDFVVAFYTDKKNSTGTRDMVKRSLKAKKCVHEYEINSPAFVVLTFPDIVERYRNVYNPTIAEMWSKFDEVKVFGDHL